MKSTQDAKGMTPYANLRGHTKNCFKMVSLTSNALKAAGFTADQIDTFEVEAVQAVTPEKVLAVCQKWASIDI